MPARVVRLALQTVLGVAALAGCAVPGNQPERGGTEPVVIGDAAFRVVPMPAAGAPAALAVRREGKPLHYSDGVIARRAAEAYCPRGVRGTIRDRFEPPETWVLLGGCA